MESSTFSSSYDEVSDSWNISSTALLSPKPDTLSFADYYPIYLRVFMLGVHPPLVAFGLLGNALVLCIMPRRAVDISTSAKLFYIVIAAADTINLLNSWVVWTFIDETMRILTNNQAFISTATSSNAACKIIFSIWNFTLCVSSYTLLALSLQRTLITLLPLRTPTLIRARVALLLMGVLVLPAVLLVMPPIPFLVGLQDRPGMKALNATMCDRLQGLPLARTYIVVADLVTYVLHPFANLALVLVTGARLVMVARRFQQLTSSLHERVVAATTARFHSAAATSSDNQHTTASGSPEEQPVKQDNRMEELEVQRTQGEWEATEPNSGSEMKRTSSDVRSAHSVSIIELSGPLDTGGYSDGARDQSDLPKGSLSHNSQTHFQLALTMNGQTSNTSQTAAVINATSRSPESENNETSEFVQMNVSQLRTLEGKTSGRNMNTIECNSQITNTSSMFSASLREENRAKSSPKDSVVPALTHKSITRRGSSPLKSALKSEWRRHRFGSDRQVPLPPSNPLPSGWHTTPHSEVEESTVRRRVSFAVQVSRDDNLMSTNQSNESGGSSGPHGTPSGSRTTEAPARRRDRTRRQSVLRSREVGATAVMLCLATINVLVFVPVAVIDIIDSNDQSDDIRIRVSSTSEYLTRWHFYTLLEENVCIALSFNCLIYILRIPAFRAEFIRIFRLICLPVCALLRYCRWTNAKARSAETIRVELQSFR